MMETTDLLTLGAWAAIWGAFSPLLISFIKNVGGSWPEQAKRWTAVGFAVIGAVVAYAGANGLGDVSLTSWSGFWVPLLAGFGVIYPMAQASYVNFWKGTRVETGLASSLTGE